MGRTSGRYWNYDNLLPFFKRIETSSRYASNPAYHGNTGPLHLGPGGYEPAEDMVLVQAGQASGLTFIDDLNGAQQITSPLGSVGFPEFTIFNGTRQTAFSSYIRPVLNRTNLWIQDSSLVAKINFIERNKRATSVDWYYLETKEMHTSFATKEIIISMGTLRSAQVLLLSGIGNPTKLNELGIAVVQDLPGVGENLQDHVVTTGSWTVNNSFPFPTPHGSLIDQAAWDLYNHNRTSILASFGIRTNFFIRTKYQAVNDSRPDIQIMMQTPSGTNLCAWAFLLHPRSRGRVTLASRDPTDAPIFQTNYFSDPTLHDTNVLMEGFRRLDKILSTAPMHNIGFNSFPNLFDDDQFKHYLYGSKVSIAHSSSGYHLTGTCKMGNDSMAVVDSRLRVRGVAGLRVADASIMPLIISGNTQAPVYMIGEKAAQMILDDADTLSFDGVFSIRSNTITMHFVSLLFLVNIQL